MDDRFWLFLDHLVSEHELVIDRPKGSHHPHFLKNEVVYPLNYGFLAGTSAADGSGIDVWLGSSGERKVTAIQVTVDLLKKDTEIKILLGCTDHEIETADRFLNTGNMSALSIKRSKEHP